MRRHVRVYILLIFLMLFTVGCRNYITRAENHKAMDLYRDGAWNIRYKRSMEKYATGQNITILSINVNKDMTEKEMLSVLDYYEFTDNADFDAKGKYIGECKTDFLCFAVFYEGDTDKEIRRIKYLKGKEVDPVEEGEYRFATPDLRTSEDERGEMQ